MLYGILAATSALLLTAVLAALLRGPVLRAGIVDRRRQRPVPLFGGLAVVAVTCLVAGTGQWTRVAPLGDGVARLLVAAAGVAALGLAADVWRLRARVLVGGTAVAAACVVPYEETGLPAGLLAVAWIVFVALAFRALDHADGLAGTVGVVTAFGAGACAAAEVMDGLAVLLSVLAAALTGFLMHNWPPARIGLGACGSLFTGFLLASAAVFARAGYPLGPSVRVLFPLTAVATADVVLVAVSRLAARRPLLRGGPDHLAHRLRRLGPTPPTVVALLGAGAFATVLAGVLVNSGWAGEPALLWVLGGASAVVLGLLRVPVYGARHRAPAQTGTRTATHTFTRTAPRTFTRTPAQTGTRSPVQTGTRSPAQTGTRTPAQTFTRTPTRTSVQPYTRTPAQTSPRSPVQAPARTPAQTSSRASGQVSAQVTGRLRVRNG